MRIHMNNGYYLSTYLHINEVAHLTGMRIRHDQNVSLWHKNGDKIDLVHYWELERITGLKKIIVLCLQLSRPESSSIAC